MPLVRRLVVFGVLAAAGACARHRTAAPAPDPQFSRAVGVAAFDSAWARIGASYHDTTFGGHDWVALRRQLRPHVEQARGMDDVRRAIDSLFSTLGQSHFVLIPAAVADAMKGDSAAERSSHPGTIGAEVRVLDGHVFLTRIEPGSAAERAGLRPGWEVVSVDGIEAAAMLEIAKAVPEPARRARATLQAAMRMSHAMRGDTGVAADLVLRAPDGTSQRTAVRRTAWPGDIIHYGPLPPQYVLFRYAREMRGDDCIGEIRFNLWMPSLLQKLDSAMTDLGDCKGLVLDLRGNTGGVAALIMGVSGFFVDSVATLGTYRSRVNTLRYIVNPRRATTKGAPYHMYRGAIAVLVDEQSASTTEVFADGMRAIGRVRVFGDTTAGQALPATMSRLPGGDLMIHAVADLESASGRRLEGNGLIPDEVIQLTRQDLLAGRDRVREAALAWLRHTQTASRVTERPGQP